MPTLPVELKYGKVVGQFIFAIADASDPDRLPDAAPAVGDVTITPVIAMQKIVGAVKVTVVKRPIICHLDSNGYLVDPQNNQGVWLVTGDYVVTYDIQDAIIEKTPITVLDTHTDVAPLDLVDVIFAES